MKELAICLLFVTIAFSVASLIRAMSVPGTRLRYVMATFMWATLVPAVAGPWLAFLVGSRISAITFLLVVWGAYGLWSDDDDNWWRRKRKSLKRWVRGLSRRQLAGSRA